MGEKLTGLLTGPLLADLGPIGPLVPAHYCLPLELFHAHA